MNKLIVPLIITTAVLLAAGCAHTGDRSRAGMADEKARLEKELAALTAEYERAAALSAQLQAELNRTRELAEETRLALAYRDRLRSDLDAMRDNVGPGGVATVAAADPGQVRRDLGANGGSAPSAPNERGPNRGDGGRSGFTGEYAGPTEVHIVKKGESLYAIAGYDEYYGNSEKWVVIYQVNEDSIRDPHWIIVGQPLLIPVD